MSTTVSNAEFIDFLKYKADCYECYLIKNVAQMILEQTDDPLTFVTDLLNHGCVSGMVCGLIYYGDTRDFYDKNYAEIEYLRQEFEENTGAPMTIHGDLKNFFAWFAFEQTAYQLADEAGLEI